ncbi:MAG: hypothetical protein IT374_27160 [Polyangiaceae bacterium]|nr:hypothetical protein [Polyangiaceae bacterium]
MRARVAAWLSQLALVACASDDADVARPDPCSADHRPPSPGSVCVSGVSGRLVDLEGTPLAARLTTVCGGDICFYGRTGGDGAFTTPVGARVVPDEYVVFAHGAPTHATLLVELTRALSTPDVRLPELVRLPRLPADGPALPPDDGPGGVVSSGGLTLSIPAGTRVSLDVEDVARGDLGRMLRVVRVSGPDLPPFARELGAAFAFAAAPFDASFSRPVGATIEVAGELSPGQAVEIWDQEASFLGDTTRTGGAHRVAEGVVSPDGREITLQPVLTRLTWLVVRLAPR